MYADVYPAFCGATYADEFQMIDADTGAALPFVPGIDALAWRLYPLLPRAAGFRDFGGSDYGFARQAAALDGCAALTLSLGQGLSISAEGTAVWSLDLFPSWLRDPEYRMTLDLLRYGGTYRVMDTILPVEN